MEPTSPLTNQQKVLGIVGVVLIVAGIGGLVWYLWSHPEAYQGPATSTTTPSEPVTGGEAPAKKIVEHATYYDIDASYPSATPLKSSVSAQADAKAVAILKGFNETTIENFKEQGNFANLSHDDIQMMGLDQRKESLVITYKTYTGPRTVSYAFTMYQDTLGAHPNAYFRTFSFDTKTGAGLLLGDLFTPGTDYLTKVSNISRAQLPKNIAAAMNSSVADVDTKYINDGTTPDQDNFQNWYLSGRNLILVFPPYQVAAYAAGPQQVTIPLADLGTSLKAEYR